MIILCFDALDKKLINDDHENLLLVTNGKTDISEFTLPRSVILWSSFLTSKNMEIYLKDILYEFELGFIRFRIPTHIGDKVERQVWGGWSGKVLGKFAPLRKYFKERIWRIRFKPEETFLRYFKSYKAIDMVALTHKTRRHKKERELMGDYFTYDVEDGILDKLREFLYYFYYDVKDVKIKAEKNRIKRTEIERIYNRYVWDGYRKNKDELLDALEKNYEVILFFTPLADLIGHLNFGSKKEMKKVYEELNSLVGLIIDRVKGKNTTILGISDHGMEQVILTSIDGYKIYTKYGDHSEVKQGTFFMNRNIEEIKARYETIRNRVKKDALMFDQNEQYEIEAALRRLEDGNPTLRDFYHIIKIYGSQNPSKSRIHRAWR